MKIFPSRFCPLCCACYNIPNDGYSGHIPQRVCSLYEGCDHERRKLQIRFFPGRFGRSRTAVYKKNRPFLSSDGPAAHVTGRRAFFRRFLLFRYDPIKTHIRPCSRRFLRSFFPVLVWFVLDCFLSFTCTKYNAFIPMLYHRWSGVMPFAATNKTRKNFDRPCYNARERGPPGGEKDCIFFSQPLFPSCDL